MGLDALHSALLSAGIDPLLAGFALGVLATLLVRMALADKQTDGSGSRTAGSPGEGNPIDIIAAGQQITLVLHGERKALPDAVSREIFGHLAGKRKIDAIRCLREAGGMGLKEAKELIEKLERQPG